MNNQLPKIRFKTYSDNWKKVRASEIFKSISDKNYLELPVLSASQEKGMILRDDIGIDIKYNMNNIQTYKRVLPGQFVIHLRSFQGGFAYSNIEGITSPAYTILDYKDKKSNSPLFWKYLLTSNKFIQLLETVTYGIRDGRSINFKDFSTLYFTVPSQREQTDIGNFFNHLEETIELNQHALKLLKLRKNALLQKMFPKEGGNIPELRFTEFDNEWRKKEIGDYLNSFSNKTNSENQYEMLSSTTNGIEKRSGRVNGKSNKGYKIIEKGDLVLSPQNLWLGNINYNKDFDIGMVSPSYKTFKLENIDHSFFSTLLRLPEMFYKYERSSLQGASVVRRNLDMDMFYQIVIRVPSLKEQEKIGNFFKELDDSITLQEEKLKSLKLMKKGFLQKIFV